MTDLQPAPDIAPCLELLDEAVETYTPAAESSQNHELGSGDDDG